ncbi:hypothetical protein E3N88_40734 [Mikania micrantha]|uniref:Uncharacterized protein n=1 Tax=Mikania micrantha TaxID=192012 RepID=A0A5N6LNK7_9ASTR|nr:hypothetical protein E3N88_40734 [Mikania micrantha]
MVVDLVWFRIRTIEWVILRVELTEETYEANSQSGELPQLVMTHPLKVEVLGSNLVGGNLMDIQVKERIRALIQGLNLMGDEGLQTPSGSRASGGTRVLRSEIEELILAINHIDAALS